MVSITINVIDNVESSFFCPIEALMPRDTQKPGTSPKFARMKEVAARADVSAMTVSRALRDPKSVSAEKLRRINKAVREVGYVPNQIAGSLKTANRTKLVAAILPSISNSLFAATLHALSDSLRSHGINLMLGDSRYSEKEEERLIRAFLSNRPSGLVLHDTTHTPNTRRLLRQSGIPIVEVGNLSGRPIDMMVSYSNFAAAKAMTEHLVQRGYQKIALVSIPVVGNERAQERRRGYLAALDEAGRPQDIDLMLETLGSYENGARAVSTLLERRPDIDAIFLAGDVLAVGAMLECRRRGWAVPDRVAIAGFDTWEMAQMLDAPITSLDIPRYEIGRLAGELILRRIAGEPPGTNKPFDVGFKVVHRKST
jgi:LacI family transcriptional regulator, gluconate utilization system Gnt-I transcriptional repressor